MAVPYNVLIQVERLVFSKHEPIPPEKTLWAKHITGDEFSYFVFNNGEWQEVSGSLVVPDISVYLSAFINDAGFITEEALNGYQEVLISGENIKTLNGESLLGSGNINIQGAGGTNTATTVASCDISKGLLIVTVADGQTAQEFSLLGLPASGCEVHVIVDNTGNSSSLTITIPHTPDASSGIKYINVNDMSSGTMTVSAGKIGEINVVSDGNKAYTLYTEA